MTEADHITSKDLELVEMFGFSWYQYAGDIQKFLKPPWQAFQGDHGACMPIRQSQCLIDISTLQRNTEHTFWCDRY